MFRKTSASSFSGNILRNVETGRVFPCAPVSIFRRNLRMPFQFGNLMLMSTKASSLWVILIQLNVRLSICFSASLLLYTASVFSTVFSYIVVDSEILFFCVLCFVTSFDKHTDAQWFALPRMLHFDPNAGQASR